MYKSLTELNREYMAELNRRTGNDLDAAIKRFREEEEAELDEETRQVIEEVKREKEEAERQQRLNKLRNNSKVRQIVRSVNWVAKCNLSGNCRATKDDYIAERLKSLSRCKEYLIKDYGQDAYDVAETMVKEGVEIND